MIANRLICLAALTLALPGCAINALRVQVAGTVANQAQAATAAAQSYLATVQDAREAANSDLIGIDAQCAPDRAYVRIKPDYAAFQAGGDASGWLCARDASADTFPTALDLAPIDRELDPDFALINAIAAYGDAITGILDDKSGDPSGDILAALATAQSGEKLINALTGAKPKIPGADDPRVQAVSGLITMLGQLASEQRQVDRLRLLAASSGSSALIRSLRDHLANWEIGRRTDGNMRLVVAKIIFAQILAGNPRPGPAERQAALADYYARNKQVYTASSLGSAIDATLAELDAADQHLRDVLRAQPKLNAADRAMLARTTQQRLSAAFASLTAAILAFKGV